MKPFFPLAGLKIPLVKILIKDLEYQRHVKQEEFTEEIINSQVKIFTLLEDKSGFSDVIV